MKGEICQINDPSKIDLKNRYNRKNLETIPFVYLIRCKITNQVYYGARFAKSANPNTMCIDYFTSSKIMREMFLSYGVENFEYQIRRTFNTADACRKWESTVLRRMRVKEHPKFINADEYLKCVNNANTTFISNLITKKCIRIKKGTPIPPGWINGNINRKKISSAGKKWYYDPETFSPFFEYPENKQINWLDGRGPTYTSNSEILKAKKSRWITDGILNYLLSENEALPNGWRFGVTRSESAILASKISNAKNKGLIKITDGHTVKSHDPSMPIPNGWERGVLLKKDKKQYTFVNRGTGEIIKHHENPDKDLYITEYQYRILNKKLNEFGELYVKWYDLNHKIQYSKCKDVPSDIVWDKIVENKNTPCIYINNGIDVIRHPAGMSMPDGWIIGNHKLNGRTPHNKILNKPAVIRRYKNIITGEIISAEDNPNSAVWKTYNSSKFETGGISKSKGKKLHVNYLTGQRRYFHPNSEIPDGFVMHQK